MESEATRRDRTEQALRVVLIMVIRFLLYDSYCFLRFYGCFVWRCFFHLVEGFWSSRYYLVDISIAK